ncbi:hypothetical protein GCM10022140_48800 [Rhodococcus aetherivorans]
MPVERTDLGPVQVDHPLGQGVDRHVECRSRVRRQMFDAEADKCRKGRKLVSGGPGTGLEDGDDALTEREGVRGWSGTVHPATVAQREES